MIVKLDHTKQEIAELIYNVFQVSYAVEAGLLKAKDFPPLKRKIQDFMYCDSRFYGLWKHQELVAVTEIKQFEASVHIQSMVVVPEYFRQGIAQQLIAYIFENYKTELFTVETGADNKPAIKLYEKHGFLLVKEFDTDFGIRKVRFEKKLLS